MKRLYRDKSDVMIAGICSGIANYLDVDPTAIRLAFVLLLFVGLGGLWIYLVLWIIMPVEPAQEGEVIEVQEEKQIPTPKKVAAPKSTPIKEVPASKAAAKKKAPPKPAPKKPAPRKPAAKKSSKLSAADKKPAAKTSTTGSEAEK